MNPIIILALIASLKKEVILLEQELVLEQTAVVATTTPPFVYQNNNPVYVPLVENPALGSVQPTSTPTPKQLGWVCTDANDFSMDAWNMNYQCPAGDKQTPLYNE
jgi:hypothetical protein